LKGTQADHQVDGQQEQDGELFGLSESLQALLKWHWLILTGSIREANSKKTGPGSRAGKLMYNQNMEYQRMITALRQKVKVQQGGVINLRSRNLKAGTTAEVIVLVEADKVPEKAMTADDLLKSGLVGMWADRKDIGDSIEYARTLRSQSRRKPPFPLRKHHRRLP
jgi:hypothetical protein